MSLATDILQRVDFNEGTPVNYKQTTVWKDGSAMNDSKADGTIYKKKGDIYYKRQYSGRVNLLWFINNDLNEAFQNADKFEEVFVPDGEYSINIDALTAKYYGDNVTITNGDYENVLSTEGQKLIKTTKKNFSFIGSGLNDLTFNGEFNLKGDTTLIVEILLLNQVVEGVTTDTYRYSLDNGAHWVDDNLVVDPSDDSETLLPLCCKDDNWGVGYSGIKIDFNSSTGHTIGDKWVVDLKKKPTLSELRDIVNHNGETFIQTKESGGIIIGKNSGSKSDLAAGSVIVGSGSFKNNVSGYSNIGLGNYVLTNNTTGALNIAIGDYALTRNTTGQDNVAIGVYTMFDNVSGYGNVGVGQDALRYNVNGHSNTAVGTQSLYFNNSIKNTAFGNYASRSNINGYANTSVGSAALINNQNGTLNTAVGGDSLWKLNGGNKNAALGESSGSKLQTGNENTFLGQFSGVNDLQKIDANNSTAIGHNSYTDKDNQIVLGNESITEIISRNSSCNLGSNSNYLNFIFAKKIVLSGLLTFPDNSTAISNGIGVGEVYKTSTGVLMVGY